MQRKEYRELHKEELHRKYKEWYDAHKEHVRIKHQSRKEGISLASRKSWLKVNYNLTVQNWEDLFHAQDGKCGVCQNTLTPNFRTHIDHDHITGTIRGL